MEIFTDFTVSKSQMGGYVMIPKREFNPELSAFSNLVLDFVDFKDRVRPMALDVTRLDVTRQYQPKSMDEIKEEERMMMDHLEIFGVDVDELGEGK